MQLRMIFIIFSLIISGCAGTYFDNATVKENWQLELLKQEVWQLEGKLAIIQPDNRQSANLYWSASDSQDVLNLNSFVGTSILSLTRTPGLATIEFNGETHYGKNAQQLANWLTGLDLPFLDDPSWLKGLPNTTSFQSDELYRVTHATLKDTQGKEWQIRYGNYQRHAGYWLPFSLSLTHNDIRLKLKIYEWDI